MNPFRIGDRVVLLVDHPDDNECLYAGFEGTVCEISYRNEVGVFWDEYICGHDCCNSCDYGHGWNVSTSAIKLAEEVEQEDIDDASFLDMIGGPK